MSDLRVLVCGGRDYSDKDRVFSTLYDLCTERGLWLEPHGDGNTMPCGIHIISGGASGADQFAIDWAVTNWISFTEFPAKWHKFGRSAGAIRNQEMLDDGKPDLVMAFPGGSGTRDMVLRSHRAGVKVVFVGR